VEAGAGCNVKDAAFSPRLQDVDKKLPFAFGPLPPVNQFIPFIYKSADVF